MICPIVFYYRDKCCLNAEDNATQEYRNSNFNIISRTTSMMAKEMLYIIKTVLSRSGGDNCNRCCEILGKVEM